MKNSEIRTIRRKPIWMGALALIIVMVLAFGTAPSNEQAVFELPEHVDIFDGIQIEEQQVPLADQSVTTSKKTTTKTVKLARKSKKTYTKTLPDKVSKSTDNKIVGSFRVIANKTVKTSTKEKYRKGSKKKTVTTTVTTTIATTVDDLAPKSTMGETLRDQSSVLNEHEQTTVKTTKGTAKTKKAKKSYTKTLPVKTKTTTEERIVGRYRVVIMTTVKAAVKEKYIKNKKKKTVTTTLTTTVVTKVYRQPTDNTEKTSQDTAKSEENTVKQEDTVNQPAQDQNNEQGSEQTTDQKSESAQEQGPEQTSKQTPEQGIDRSLEQGTEDAAEQSTEQSSVSAIRKSASKADENVLKAFEDLGFTLRIDSKYAYTGYFSARDRSIVLRRDGDNVYHELGHFLAFVAGNVDTGSAFKSIYNEEKSLYDGRNATYVLGTSSEYFAESYREYVLNKDALKTKRPKTCAAIDDAVSRITDAQVKRIKALYGGMWE